jgi:magnesium-transporting ATPase (P-type)
MSIQDILYKIALIAAAASIVQWFIVYTVTQPWWKDKIGRNLVYFAALVMGLIVGPTLSLFFNLNRFTSDIVGWVDLGLIALIVPVFLNRSIIWMHEHRSGNKEEPEPW